MADNNSKKPMALLLLVVVAVLVVILMDKKEETDSKDKDAATGWSETDKKDYLSACGATKELCECFLSVREEEFDTYADEKAWLAANPQDKQNASDEEIEKFLEMADKLDKADAEKCKVK